MSHGNVDQEKPKSERTQAREAFFLEFASTIRRDIPDVPLMVTGGFRTRQGIEAALQDGACDLAGIGRPATVMPCLPKEIIFNPGIENDAAAFHIAKIQPHWLMTMIGLKVVGAAADTVSETSVICAGVGTKIPSRVIIRSSFRNSDSCFNVLLWDS